ncbi:NAD(P)-dependent oxidoreductase [Paractinoplanes toevensis]|uniref:NAD(P)-binding domain-containing protein n=1 Tax=Paractinoplanes toevensis TaxID=571911 RepID=A0A919TD32_9ACTN|nr:NAD(P)H-binding protein [Actinoplanes toevensis]GIM92611.1 hypothetical protein Ato02nite_044040 [Actinoplanes toevensis]
MSGTIAVFGPTGATGRLLIEQAVGRGLDVVAVARRPQALAGETRIRVVGAELTDAPALADALRGCTAVISALGVSSLGQARRGTDVYSAGTRAIIEAMRSAAVERLVVLSSSGVRPQDGDSRLYRHILKPFFLEPVYRDIRLMEGALAGSDRRWTVVRAPYLHGDSRDVRYRVSLDGRVPGDAVLSRWKLAYALLDVATGAEYERRVISVY